MLVSELIEQLEFLTKERQDLSVVIDREICPDWGEGGRTVELEGASYYVDEDVIVIF